MPSEKPKLIDKFEVDYEDMKKDASLWERFETYEIEQVDFNTALIDVKIAKNNLHAALDKHFRANDRIRGAEWTFEETPHKDSLTISVWREPRPKGGRPKRQRQ